MIRPAETEPADLTVADLTVADLAAALGMPRAWMSPAQLADWWGVHVNTAYEWLADLEANHSLWHHGQAKGKRYYVPDVLAACRRAAGLSGKESAL